MRFGSNEDLISETMEIEERLLRWSKDQELPFHAYKKHIVGQMHAEWSEREAHHT